MVRWYNSFQFDTQLERKLCTIYSIGESVSAYKIQQLSHLLYLHQHSQHLQKAWRPMNLPTITNKQDDTCSSAHHKCQWLRMIIHTYSFLHLVLFLCCYECFPHLTGKSLNSRTVSYLKQSEDRESDNAKLFFLFSLSQNLYAICFTCYP